MKFFSAFFLSILVPFFSLQAQVNEETLAMSLGAQPALTVVLKDADVKFAEQEWKDYVKNYGKVVKVKGSKESVVPDIHLGDMGAGEKIDVYSYAEPAAEGTKMIVWIDLGESFINSKHDSYARAEKFMATFAHKVQIDLVALDLGEQEKKLEKYHGDHDKLVKENSSLHKTIDDAKAKIAQAEIDIQTNLKDQETAQAEIASQKSVVESVQDNPDELKAQQKILAKNESNYAKLQKDNASLHKLIDDSNAKIKQAETDITTNLEAQESAQAMIDEQQTVVLAVQKKLDTMKSQKPGETPKPAEPEKKQE